MSARQHAHFDADRANVRGSATVGPLATLQDGSSHLFLEKSVERFANRISRSERCRAHVGVLYGALLALHEVVDRLCAERYGLGLADGLVLVVGFLTQAVAEERSNSLLQAGVGCGWSPLALLRLKLLDHTALQLDGRLDPLLEAETYGLKHNVFRQLVRLRF